MAITQAQIDALTAKVLASTTKRTTIDGTTVENHSISETLELLRYAQTCQAFESGRSPFKIQKMRSGGTYSARLS